MATKSVKKTVKEAARMGKGRDNTLAHLASGEVVIPVGFQQKFPAVGAALKQAFEKAGLDYEQFVVGSPKNRINPRTGAPMFDDGGGGDGGGGEGGGGGGDEGGGGGPAGGEGAGADEGGGGFGGYGGGFGGYGDMGDAAGYSGPAGDAMGAAAADAGYGSTGSTGSTGTAGGDPSGGDPSGGDPAGGAPAGGAPAGGPTGGDPTGGPIGGDPNLDPEPELELELDPEPDIPTGYQMQGTLPGQATANSIFDALLGFLAPSSTLVQDPTAEQVESGFRGGVGNSSPQEQGARAEEIAREDQINALREDVARNEEAANALMQAHQQSQAAAAAQQTAANAGVTSGGLLSGQSLVDNSLGLTAPSPGLSDYGGPVYSSDPTTSQEIVSGPATNQDTTSFPEGDLAGTTGNLGMGSTEGQQGNTGSNLSALDVTEITNAPSVFDLTTTGNLSNVPYSDENYYVGSDGGDVPIPLTEEELLRQQQQVSIAPTVTPVKYDISKFISGIGSLATSKQA